MYRRMLTLCYPKGRRTKRNPVCSLPVTAIATVLSRNSMTARVALNELETAGLYHAGVRRGRTKPIYADTGNEDAALFETSKLENSIWELEKSEKKLRKVINDEKHCSTVKAALPERNERTGSVPVAALESCKSRTPGQMMMSALLKPFFTGRDTQELLKTAGTEKPKSPIIKRAQYTSLQRLRIAFSEGSCRWPVVFRVSSLQHTGTPPPRWPSPAVSGLLPSGVAKVFPADIS